MPKHVHELSVALKKLFIHLRSSNNNLSFIIMIGKKYQGKTTLLIQSGLTEYPFESDLGIKIFYNQQGVILELTEDWFRCQNTHDYSFKKLNSFYRKIQITGVIFTINIYELISIPSIQLQAVYKTHLHLLKYLTQDLNLPIYCSLFFTKSDKIAGFCDFFQTDNAHELDKSFGFSLGYVNNKTKQISFFKTQFKKIIEELSQKVIKKIHPVRSTVKRTLIREFPLQFSELEDKIKNLIQQIPTQTCKIYGIYFTSAAQGGENFNTITKKIQNEYSLAIPHFGIQANNYRPYFIKNTLKNIQKDTIFYPPSYTSKQIHYVSAGISIGILLLSTILFQYQKTTSLLDSASKELIVYETSSKELTDKSNSIYHLHQALTHLEKIPKPFIGSYIKKFTNTINKAAASELKDKFLNQLLKQLEEKAFSNQLTVPERFKILKVYLMLTDNQHFAETEIMEYFQTEWENLPKYEKEIKFNLLAQIKKINLQPESKNDAWINSMKSYLNALPKAYLDYNLAKVYFIKNKTKLTFPGFNLANEELPYQYTKAGFNNILTSLPSIIDKIKSDQWVLGSNYQQPLLNQVIETYCFEYLNWWQNFIKRTHVKPFTNYQEGEIILQQINTNNSFTMLMQLIRENITAESELRSSLFNRYIAKHFTQMSFVDDSTLNEINSNFQNLAKYLATLNFMENQDEIVFNITKARFNGTSLDPLTNIYAKQNQLLEPLSTWLKQSADNVWQLFIIQSKEFLNKRWQDQVYQQYSEYIANHYPFENNSKEEIALSYFDQFFSPNGILQKFIKTYTLPFMDTSKAQWEIKQKDGYMLPINNSVIEAFIRGNIITNMFFPKDSYTSSIEFSLQKLNLDPFIAALELSIGETYLKDDQYSSSFTLFKWPKLNSRLKIDAIDGKHYSLLENGAWGFFRLLDKVNVLIDENDSKTIQILFEINGNSGRYLLKTNNLINPFTPGILNGFKLEKTIV